MSPTDDSTEPAEHARSPFGFSRPELVLMVLVLVGIGPGWAALRSSGLGETGEDNSYGHGLVDAYAAVLMSF